jgi:hypothetical protein
VSPATGPASLADQRGRVNQNTAAWHGRPDGEERKAFFFEKKNQKTFGHGFGLCGEAEAKLKKFFASFFQKRSPCFLSPSNAG